MPATKAAPGRRRKGQAGGESFHDPPPSQQVQGLLGWTNHWDLPSGPGTRSCSGQKACELLVGGRRDQKEHKVATTLKVYPEALTPTQTCSFSFSYVYTPSYLLTYAHTTHPAHPLQDKTSWDTQVPSHLCCSPPPPLILIPRASVSSSIYWDLYAMLWALQKQM